MSLNALTRQGVVPLASYSGNSLKPYLTCRRTAGALSQVVVCLRNLRQHVAALRSSDPMQIVANDYVVFIHLRQGCDRDIDAQVEPVRALAQCAISSSKIFTPHPDVLDQCDAGDLCNRIEPIPSPDHMRRTAPWLPSQTAINSSQISAIAALRSSAARRAASSVAGGCDTTRTPAAASKTCGRLLATQQATARSWPNERDECKQTARPANADTAEILIDAKRNARDCDRRVAGGTVTPLNQIQLV